MPRPPEAGLLVRRAAPADLAPITAIYNHYIETTAITFDIKPYTPQMDAPKGEVRVPDWTCRLVY